MGAVDLEPVRGRARPAGCVCGSALDAEVRGQGLVTEAVQAMVDAAFMLTGTPLVAASARVLDPGFRRVLEKCGSLTAARGSTPPEMTAA